MIPFEKIQLGLKEWFAKASTIPIARVQWANEDQKADDAPRARLRMTRVKPLGQNERIRIRGTITGGVGEYDEEQRYVIAGHRLLTLETRVICRSQKSNEHAMNFTEIARTTFEAFWTIELFKANGLAFVQTMDTVTMDRKVDGRWQSEALFETIFGCTAVLKDERSGSGVIDSFDFSGVLTVADGLPIPDSLQANNERVPPEE